MPNNNVAILSIMSKFDEKSAREAAKRADKVYEEALSDIGNVNFDKKLIENFDKAMNLLKNKFKKVNLSSYTNSLLDSIFSDKDITEKSKDIESFINKIEILKKASSGQDINAFNTFSAKQIDALISRTEKLAQKQEEINEKTREYNREATKIAKANRSISTIDKNYGNQDYSKTLESLKKSLGTEKEFTAEQNQSIENLAKMVNLYQVMEKSEPQKGTAEAIRYSKDLLAVTQKIKEERNKIDAFSQKGASTYITNNGLSSIDKVSDYTVNKAKEDFVKASLSNLKTQEAKLQSELTTYISESVQKNLAKVSKEVDAVVDKAEKRVENLQNKIESLQTKSTKTGSDNSIIGGIVSNSDIKTLEEIEDRLYAISDLVAEGEATKQQLKEYIQLYKQYEQLVASDSTVKFDSGLKEEYDFILESDNKLKKYADTLDETISKQKELNAVKSNENEVSVDTQTEQLVKQEEQIKETIQAEKQLQDIQEKISSNTKISVDAEQAIADINKIKESLDSIPEEKNIKITISDSDYTNTPLLSDAEGNTITAFRGVVGAWSGLINQDGIGFFTDKLKLAADYADSLAESGKVYQANLSFKSPLEVEGNGAKWDEIDFNGVKKTTDEIVELAKQLGHDGVIFKNIRDGFTDTDEDISNVMVALNAAQIKNEQVIGTVKAGTGEMVDVASKIDNATDTATNSTVESQNKIQEELKETQKVAEQVSEAMSNVGSDKSNISSTNPTVEVSQNDEVVVSIRKKKEELASYELQLEETRYEIEKLSKAENESFGFNRSHTKKEQISSLRDSVTRNIFGKPDNGGRSGQKKWFALGDISNIDSSVLKSYQMWNEELSKAGYKLSEIRAIGKDGLEADIIPIDGKAITNAEEFRKALDNITTAPSENVELLNKQVSELESKISSLKAEIASLQSNQKSPIKDVFQGDDNSNTSFSSNLDEIEKEKSALLELRNSVSLIIEEIDKKTQAFHNEKSAVDLIITEEIATLESLERELKIIIESIEQISKIPINIDFNLENLDENSANVISKLKDSLSGFNGSSLTNISSILEGFKISKANVENLQKLANAILTLKSNLNNVGNSGQQFLSDIKELVAQSDGLKDLATVLKSSQKQIDNAKKTTNANVDSKNTEENTNAWKELTYSIQRYSEVSKRVSSGKALEGDIEEASRLENKISQLQKLDILSPTQIEKSEQMLTKLYDILDDIEKKSKEVTLESLNSSIDKYRNDYNSRSSKPFIDNQSDKYKKLLVDYETSIAKLEAYRDKISNNPLVSKEDLNQIDELKKKVKESATAFNSLTASQKGSTPLSRGKTIEWANDLLEQNSKWSKKAKIEVQGWINKLATADPSNVEEIRNRILEVVRAEREAGNAGKTWLDIFSTKKLHSFLGQAASMFSFYDLINVGREGINTLKEFDDGLTKISYTMDMTKSQLDGLGKSVLEMANDLDSSINNAMQVSQIYANMNTSAEEIKKLSEPTLILSNLTGFDTSTVADDIQAVTQQFDIAAESSMHIADVYDQISRNISVDYSKGIESIAEAVQVAGSTANQAGLSFEQLAAIVGKTVEKTRLEGSQVGNGLKTIMTRLSKVGELSEEVDNETLSQASESLKKVGIEVYNLDGSYREFDVIMGELAGKWDDLTDAEKSNISFNIAATRQTNLLSAVLSNFSDSMQLAEEATNANGNALENNQKWVDSFGGHLQSLENTAKSAWINILDSETIKGGVDVLNSLLKVVVELIDTFGLLPTAAGIGGIVAGFKNIGREKCYPSYRICL